MPSAAAACHQPHQQHQRAISAVSGGDSGSVPPLQNRQRPSAYNIDSGWMPRRLTGRRSERAAARGIAAESGAASRGGPQVAAASGRPLTAAACGQTATPARAPPGQGHGGRHRGRLLGRSRARRPCGVRRRDRGESGRERRGLVSSTSLVSSLCARCAGDSVWVALPAIPSVSRRIWNFHI